MRIPFRRPQPAPSAERARPAGGDLPAVEAARARARRRLVGAVVLLVIGVVGFPVLFETQPRPLPVDTPIELAHRETTAASAPAPARVAPGLRPLPVTTLPADAGNEGPAAPDPASAPPAQVPAAPVVASGRVTPPSATVGGTGGAKGGATGGAADGVVRAAGSARSVAAAASSIVPQQTDPAVPRPTPATPPSGGARPSDGDRARALLEAGEGGASAVGGRYVVQVGAYGDPAKLHEARAKVEKLGLKTYTQVIDSEAGKRTRVRVGPYATREQADEAAARLRHSGLPVAVLAL